MKSILVALTLTMSLSAFANDQENKASCPLAKHKGTLFSTKGTLTTKMTDVIKWIRSSVGIK